MHVLIAVDQEAEVVVVVIDRNSHERQAPTGLEIKWLALLEAEESVLAEG